ncbi:MAG: FAD:protein FMN transferase [Oscillospiraceae bacterium]|jgi:thiamine biosynthesis lipoprotein|nr:FAD:protein FMN transferase [Oscillospiraceae bacterium]
MTEKIKKRKSLIAVLLMVVALVSVIGADLARSNSAASSISPSFIMGTLVDVSLRGFGKKSVSEDIFAAMRDDENNILSWRVAASVVGRLNADRSVADIDLRVTELLNEIKSVCALTGGRMDLTVGALTKLWDFESGQNKVPSQEEIAAALATVGFQNLTASGTAAALAGTGSIDLGAFGKGVACDTAWRILKESRIKGGTVSVGGSVLVFGEPEKNGAWTIGIRDPDGAATEVFASLKVEKECVISTSGLYERGFESGGKYYHHILDAKTGWPAGSGLKSVTIIAPTGLLSDALSTACFILGYDESLPLLTQFGVEAVFVGADNTVRVTNGLRTQIVITNGDFVIEW